MKLHGLTKTFLDLFNQFDLINEWEPDTNADGVPFDDDGNIICLKFVRMMLRYYVKVVKLYHLYIWKRKYI